MTQIFTLIHMSDVHLGPIEGFHWRYWNIKRGVGYLNWHRGRVRVHRREVANLIAADALAQAADHIAVTGDLANIGLPGEYGAATEWLASLGEPDRVSVVPGNHDIYTARLHGASCLDTWAPYMRSGEAWTASEPVRFPFVKIIGPVALIGLNSAIPTPLFSAMGRLGEAQLAEFATCLDRLKAQELIRVVLIHHPPLPDQAPPRRALSDAAAFADVLDRCGAELVLHGHNHRDTLLWRSGVPVLGISAASTGRSHHGEPLARYRVLRLSRDEGRTRIVSITRGLAIEGGEVVALDERELVSPNS
ncbi:metallophosphoesterase family protein [Hyphomicrobium sp.]|uniref:metallophosphoesterase family protein n=1 Tax=Hyphomicrobium sp. TaxID=82 RepID=UPI003F7214AB